MKAIICKQYGPPSKLSIEEHSKPTISSKEILVKVYSTTVNRTDCAILRAKPFVMRFVNGLFKPKHAVIGTDFAGEVMEIGSSVSKFKVGDRVAGFNDLGLESYAAYMSISEDAPILQIPKDYAFDNAVASMEGVHYAYNFINKVELSKGQRVVVNGATGAIGIALLQFLKFHGLFVTAVCKGEDFSLIESLGADKLFDYEKEDFTKDKEQYDYVFDAVGKSSFRRCKRLLKDKGIYISSELGKRSINLFLSLRPKALVNKSVIFPIPVKTQESLDYVLSLITKNKFRGIVDRVYSMDEVVQAFEYVETGEKKGNVIIRIHT